MRQLIITLRPLTAFATPLAGDTLFGQLCWAIRHGWGEARLVALLDGYTENHPFLIVGDAFPAGHLPLPALPAACWADQPASATERKALKQKVWLPAAALATPLENWRAQALPHRPAGADFSARPQPRNSLNRLTGATGKGDGFAPYTVRQHWHEPGTRLDIHLRLDEQRLSSADLAAALEYIGAAGFGKDANVGLGKFSYLGIEEVARPAHAAPDAWFTLAPCAPQGLSWASARSFYRPLTRYGRHGDLAARGASPFKSPLLLAAAGALLTPQNETDWSRGWVGQGLDGDGSISRSLPGTVHQGYAPAIPVRLPAGIALAEIA